MVINSGISEIFVCYDEYTRFNTKQIGSEWWIEKNGKLCFQCASEQDAYNAEDKLQETVRSLRVR